MALFRSAVVALFLALMASAVPRGADAFSLRQLLGSGGGPRGHKPMNGTAPPHNDTHPPFNNTRPPFNGTWPEFNGTGRHGNHSHPWVNGTEPFNYTSPGFNGTERGNHSHPWFNGNRTEFGNISGHHGPVNSTFKPRGSERGRRGY